MRGTAAVRGPSGGVPPTPEWAEEEEEERRPTRGADVGRTVATVRGGSEGDCRGEGGCGSPGFGPA